MLDPNSTLVWAMPQPSPVQGCCRQSPAVLCQQLGCFTQQQREICPPGWGWGWMELPTRFPTLSTFSNSSVMG